jgi:hypothetical protein
MKDAMDGRFYFEKGKVWRAPHSKPRDGGGESITMGFHVCTVSDLLSQEGGEAIAKALNEALDKGWLT